jgi:hypothetical protein
MKKVFRLSVRIIVVLILVSAAYTLYGFTKMTGDNLNAMTASLENSFEKIKQCFFQNLNENCYNELSTEKFKKNATYNDLLQYSDEIKSKIGMRLSIEPKYTKQSFRTFKVVYTNDYLSRYTNDDNVSETFVMNYDEASNTFKLDSLTICPKIMAGSGCESSFDFE